MFTRLSIGLPSFELGICLKGPTVLQQSLAVFFKGSIFVVALVVIGTKQ